MTSQAQLEINQNDAAHVPEYVTIQGTIQRIVFHNPENGYCVLSVVTKDEDEFSICDPVLKLTGHLAAPRENDEYRFTGTWTVHPRFGRQFQFTDAELLLPVGKSGIARYLSNITSGVGIVKAEKIAQALGEDALSQIRENPKALEHPDLSFLTDTQKTEITTDLTKNSIQAELAALICGPGIGLGTVHKILNTLGSGPETLESIKQNPYMLCEEVFGIGFKLADAIALKIGIKKDSPFRIDAALNFVLREAAGEGHCYLTPALIVEGLLGTVEAEQLTGMKLRGRREKKKEGIIAYSGVGVEDIAAANQRLVDQGRCVREGDAVYAKALYVAEKLVAERVKALISQEPHKIEGLEPHIHDIESRDGVEYAPEQKEAIVKALTQPLSIITGGPGTGKTTVINAVCEIYGRINLILPVYLAAPTGRAAKRMGEATGQEAKTIHRLLAYNPNMTAGNDGGFGYNINNPLPGPGLIIIDEMSMTDIELTASLFAAMEVVDEHKTHQVVFVGDVDQLPSVGPGSVLRDLISSSRVPTTHLKFNYRQAGGSKIAEFAHRVCRGEMLQLKSIGDFEFSPVENGDEAVGTVTSLVQSYVQSQDLSPLDWQVLVPMRRGSCGVKELNKALREIVNPAAPGIPTLGSFRVGDKVMVIKNNYQLDVFNGDIGIVVGIEKGKLSVDFGDKEVDFAVEHLELLTLAYASTIHKAQGSEFKLVIMGLCSQHYVMLQRNLLYTGMTRAKERLVLVGDVRSVAMAVKNNRIEERLSRLKERVAGDG
jgi:exodeoxyribonuclease V alpha subunit